MKVIFLDIDGVLNVYCQGRDEYGCTFHKHFEDNLRWIIEETGAKIVISSTWRRDGLDNFVHTPRSSEGIKQSGIKEKIIKFLQ